MENEEWRFIAETNNLYEVSNYGRVRSNDRIRINRWGPYLARGKLLKMTLNAYGYPLVGLHVDGKVFSRTVHRLVGEAFLNRLPGHEINHKDCNKQNNAVWNLEWVNHQANMAHAVENNRINHAPGVKARTKLTQENVDEIRGLAATGITHTSLGQRFGVTQTQISRIVARRRWA